MTANILLTTSKVLTLDIDSNQKIDKPMASCSLKWRQQKLWVKKTKSNSAYVLPALIRPQWLQNCLKLSSVKQICIDPQLDEATIRLWANVGKKAKKQIFLRIHSCRKALYRQNNFSWRVKRALDWSAAAVLLLLASPVLLIIALLIKILTPGPIFFRQWRVGTRGRLFQIYKFRTMVVDAERQHHQVMGGKTGLHKCENDPRVTPLGRWLRKYSLDELPQLLNVLRGELSLVGPRPWALYDALRLGESSRERLNALPGITGAWQVAARSKILELDAVTKYDLDYLHSWSLTKDLTILLMTLPQVLSGRGAY